MASQAMPLATVSVLLTTYGGSPDVTCLFTPDGWALFMPPLNAEPVFFSFNGTDTHGVLIPGTSTPQSYGGGFTQIWFKRENNDAMTKPSLVYCQASVK